MFECPNCGGNLKFDIASQQIKCPSCDSQFDPYEVKKENAVSESNMVGEDEFNVTVFTCPQCAGEIYSTDNTAAGFCIFCGASNILNTRLQNERRPGYIIPFQKTKADCKEAYMKMMRHAIFAPKELKAKKHIDGFRGIYMPYWVYYVTQQGAARLMGQTSHRSGDYIITEHYNLDMEMNSYYKGLSYDASSSFSDSLSGKLAPFDVKNMKEFTPSFLSGFYADTCDVEAGLYERDAMDIANKKTKKYLKKSTEVKKYKIETPDSGLDAAFHTRIRERDIAMFPVWFMSYRNKDRVAYATVNGQTGKVVADLPVDLKKYVLGSMILAVPIAILLNLFFTLQPATLLVLVAFFAAGAMLLYSKEIKQIAAKENYEDDRGMTSALERMRQKRKETMAAKRQAAAAFSDGTSEPIVMTKEDLKKPDMEEVKEEAKKRIKKKSGHKSIGYIVGAFICINMLVNGTISALIALNIDLKAIGVAAALIIALVAGISGRKHAGRIQGSTGIGFVFVIAAIVLAELVIVLHPVSDLYYYISVILTMAAVLWVLLDLMRNYNFLATRKLPQFAYKGGDDRA